MRVQCTIDLTNADDDIDDIIQKTTLKRSIKFLD
jgi:hypothetical protein